MYDKIFNWCVAVLNGLADMTGATYTKINVIIFCVIWPLLTVFLIGMIIYQRKKIQVLKRNLDFFL